MRSAVPDSVSVTVVVAGSVLSPSMVAVTVTTVRPSSSPMESGSTVSVIELGVPSSSVIVVVTESVPSTGAGPPPPCGLEMETVNVSPLIHGVL